MENGEAACANGRAQRPILNGRLEVLLEGFNRSGGIRIWTAFVNALAGAGADVTIVVPDYASQVVFALHPSVKIRALTTIGEGKWRNVVYLLRLVARRVGEDQIVLFGGYRIAWATEISRWLFGKPKKRVYFLQGPEDWLVRQYCPGPRWFVSEVARLAKAAVQLDVTFLTVSRWLKTYSKRPDAVVIADGVDLECFHPGAGRRPGTRKLVVGAFASQAVGKGFGDLMTALSLLSSAAREELFLLAATDSIEISVDATVEIEVRHVGDDAAIAEFYRSCDVFVFPSRMEGFGLPPLEALACGTPVIVTDCGGVREYATDACMWIAEPASPASLARAIEKVIQTREHLKELGAVCVKEAGRFSIQRAAEAYIAFMADLAASQKA